MSAANPTFFLGDDYEAAGHTFPMADVTAGTLTMGPVDIQERVSYRQRPLFQRSTVNIDDETPSKITRLRFSVTMRDGQRMGDLVSAKQQLRDSIGYSARHLWLVDDGNPAASEGLLTSNGEASGPGQTIDYTPDATSWLAANDFLFYPISEASHPYTSGSEVIVCTSVSSTQIVADLDQAHSTSMLCFKAFAVYPNAVCESITMSEAPLGKGSIRLQWICPEEPVLGTTLPTDSP